MRPIRTISVFPTLLTLGNLICGFFAIVVAARIEKPGSPVSCRYLFDTQNLDAQRVSDFRGDDF